jgi:SAM-dependent methyltransferase
MTMKLYDELAEWWPLLSAPEDYATEAAKYAQLILTHAHRPVSEVLELGSGGGNNASHLKHQFSLTLVEPSNGMRKVSRALNPECRHVPGDMRTVRLGRTFDAVFVHDAIGYMTTESDLRKTLTTVALHLAPGGVALVCPDATRETFRPGVHFGGHDEPRSAGDDRFRSLRYLEWTLPPKNDSATHYDAHFAILLRRRDGSVRVIHDVHRLGLFPRATWKSLFGQAGLQCCLASLALEGPPQDVFVALAPRRGGRG